MPCPENFRQLRSIFSLYFALLTFNYWFFAHYSIAIKIPFVMPLYVFLFLLTYSKLCCLCDCNCIYIIGLVDTVLIIGLQRCTSEPQFFLSRYDNQYFNGILPYRKTIEYIPHQKSEITLPTFRNYCFNQFNDSLPKYRPILATGLHACLVLLCMLPNLYFSRW